MKHLYVIQYHQMLEYPMTNVPDNDNSSDSYDELEQENTQKGFVDKGTMLDDH